MSRGIVLITVIITVVVLVILALVTVHIMIQQAYIAEHKIKRLRAFFIAKAGLVHALERLRNGDDPSVISNEDLDIDNDGTSDADIQIGPPINNPGSPLNGTRPISVTVNY
ncbi:MAG: hypothetical protein DRP81_01075 [Candidatus Omnitrophota bacterium]|nr:MAG: hypothetical protein DRP81_01075 [Candidatus Omnitrophota bacterium]